MLWPLLVLLALASTQALVSNPLIDSLAFFGSNSASQSHYWPNVSSAHVVAQRTQRDVAANVSIALNSFYGVDLTNVAFESAGYNSSGLAATKTLLDLGFNALVLDIYYNNYTSEWGLCPQSMLLKNSTNTRCDPATLNLDSFANTINTFLVATNNVLQTNVMLLLFKLHSISVSSDQSNSTFSSISTSLNLQSVVLPYTINVEQLPTIDTLLTKLKSRVLPIVLELDVPNWTPELQLFYSSVLQPSLESALSPENFISIQYQSQDTTTCDITAMRGNTSSIQLAYDTATDPFSTQSYWSAIMCGYCPVLSHTPAKLTDLAPFLDVSLWSWAPFQPSQGTTDLMDSDAFREILGYGTADKTSLLKDVNSTVATDEDDEDVFVNRCAVLTSAGWVATSCLNKFYSLCQSKVDDQEIVLSNDKSDYIHAPDECSSMGHYKLYIPTNSLDQLQAIEMIPHTDQALWIDLNSLSTENCWVVGIYSFCPYQLVVSRKLFAEMIIPNSIVAAALLGLIFLLQFDRQPVIRNKKHWKKLHGEVNDPDGVPI